MAYLKASNHFEILKISSLYTTSPLGPRQRDFKNAVIKVKTDLSANLLLNLLKSIERQMGRKKSAKIWGPRVIDLDILFYDKKTVNKPHLKIPHPEIANRRFILQPLLEISPNMIHFKKKATIKKLYKQLLTAGNQKAKITGKLIGG